MLQPLFSHQFGGTIWRMEIDELTDILLLEIRNSDDKQVSFASLSLTTGQLYFEGFTTEERWLTGLEAVYDGVALLHYYKHEGSPEHKGIVAIGAQDATALWSNYSHAFDHLSTNGPIVYDTSLQPKKPMLADMITGRPMRSYQPADAPLPNSIAVPANAPARDFVAGILPLEPYGNIVHSLDYNNYRIVSLHTLKNGALQQHLYIMEDPGVVYTDLLNTNIQKLQPEAFVLHKNVLVYIKNKTEIIVLAL
ncbi:DUF4905 domain-containing protein [Mucilaginibacter psychrotolerans]|nr:DUF4905 domain-containing protein [Mucilaginibacter psychrotolerans]